MTNPVRVASHWPKWLIAGLQHRRQNLVQARNHLRARPGIPPEVIARGVAAYTRIIEEIDTQIRDLDFGWDA